MDQPTTRNQRRRACTSPGAVLALLCGLLAAGCGGSSSNPRAPCAAAGCRSAPSLEALVPDSLVVQVGTTASLMVALTGVVDAASVVTVTSDGAGVTVPAAVLISAGSATSALPVDAVAAGTATVTATYAGIERSASVTAFAVTIASVVPASGSAAGGTTVTTTLEVSSPPPAPAVVHVSVDGGATIDGGDSLADLIVPAGLTSIAFDVGLASWSGTVTIQAEANGSSQCASIAVSGGPPPCSPAVVISGVYGGGGGSVYKCDLVELHNRSGAVQDLGGWSIEYASMLGTAVVGTHGVHVLPAGLALPAGGYLLLQESCGAAGSDYPVAADVVADASSGVVSMSATGGKVFLVQGSGPLTLGAGGCPQAGTVVDFVSWGAGNSCAAFAPAASTGTTTALSRNGAGCVSTGSSQADLTIVTLDGSTFRSGLTAPLACTAACQ